MNPNTHSNNAAQPRRPLAPPQPPASLTPPAPPESLELPEDLAEDLVELVAVLDKLATRDLDRLSGTVRAQRALVLQQLAGRLSGQALKELAGVDAIGAAGADRGEQARSTAGWLRRRLRMSAGAAHETVRTARALFRGPLPGTAHALLGGQLSPSHARVLARGTRHLPDDVVADAEPVLLEAATRLDPPLLRQAVGYLCQVADPDGTDAARQRRHERRGLWLAVTLDHMVAVHGLLEPEAGELLQEALEPLARPTEADDTREGGQRTADALTELCRRALQAGELPKTGGVRPQLLVTVDLNSLVGAGGVGGELGWAGPLDREACRRLACDGAVTRVVVSRQPTGNALARRCRCQAAAGVTGDHGDGGATGELDQEAGLPERLREPGLQARLRAALVLLPPVLGGAPRQPLDVGRGTRVVTPAQRSALAVRDGGCVFPGCDRPLAWCDGHHLISWLDGGPTDLANLALLCRAHHRAVHEGGWQLTRGPDGRFTASPGPPAHRRHRRGPPTAA